MPVERSHWKTWFRDFPAWECPTCGKGHLKVIKDFRHEKETGLSARSRKHYEWEPDWISGRFVALLECDFAACGEVASMSGNYSVDVEVIWDYNGEPDQSWADFFQVQAISPTPLAVRPIKAAPENVKIALSKASALVWQSEEAAANSIRQAVEHLMDARKVKKLVVKNGKKTRLSLHARIEEFRKKDPENANILFAVKWLGNVGSHAGGLTRDHVLDAFDFVELALDNLYGTTKAIILKKVKSVNKNRGPAKT